MSLPPIVLPVAVKFTTRVVLAPADNKIGDKDEVTLDDIADQPFIKLDSRGPLGQLLSAQVESSGLQLNTVANVETYHVAKALVSNHAGVTITDEVTAKSEGYANIVVRPLSPTLRFKISALRSDKMPLSVVSKKFLTHVDKCIQDFLNRPVQDYSR